MLNNYKDDMNNKKQVYLIGGAPLVGKSTIVNRLEGYTKFSTDDIRSYLHQILKPEDNPDLFYGHGLDALNFYQKYNDAQTVFEHETKQADATQIGVDALIDVGFGFNKIAIEGIAITPAYVDKLMLNKNLELKYIFLFDSDNDRIRERIFSRGLYDDADKYPDWIKDIEVEWVVMYNNFYKEQCEKYGFEIFNVNDIESIKL